MEERSGINGFGKVFLVACLLFVCFVMTFGMFSEIAELEPTEPPETKPIIPEEERVSIPDPDHFFGLVLEDAVFEELPKTAIAAYSELLTGTYGLQEQAPKEMIGMEHISFTDPKTGESLVRIYYSTARVFGGPDYFSIRFSDYCRLEEREVWDGDMEQYLYNPDHWEDCPKCGGLGKCRTCYGRGMIDTGLGYDINYENCPDCRNGECTNLCYKGKVRK